VELTLARCTLRPWRRGDESSLVLHANDRRVWLNLRDRFPHPYTAKDADEWIAHAGAQAPVLNFAIVVDGAAVGGIGLEPGTDVHRRSAEVGYWLGPPFWGRGIATEALRAVTDYAFTALSTLFGRANNRP
jgi:RimJ/RimL family protein N-acetyltransferase